ncbi:phosphoribosylglycinamide formyltransferase [Enterococcus sp. JM4C]|uniref:phosphoribosylglycinamide formyltransferase n=1 Tax=Candidatus Enterococcus huntleyi TaxID=1857217 RepID=UPI0013794915|nr:phosphoribosylglycinamide formyltransferase [Enterococcus sp. JM4C]KAF1297685.1 phosphoribosylglycinamide formyltransferase [Enterococcus sp. JM4C]
MRAAILASGNGSNFEAIIQAVERQEIAMEVALVFSDKSNAYVLERAKNHQVEAVSFSPKDFSEKSVYEAELLHLLEEYQVEWVILAGYMRIIGPCLLEAFPQRIINIHPSLLPNFPGLHGIKDAFTAKVPQTGVTVHYIDAGVDTGPVIAQEAVTVAEEDTLESLEAKIHQVEHRLYPKVLAEISHNYKGA